MNPGDVKTNLRRRLYRVFPLETTCPHCARLRTKLLCWRIGAVIGWALLFWLLTVCK